MSQAGRQSRVLGIIFLSSLASTVSYAGSEHRNENQAVTGPRLSLGQAIQEARKYNPDLLAVEAQADATGLQEETELYLPPPALGIGSMGMQGPLASGGHMQTSYQMSQQIPFPTKIARRREAVRQEAAAAREAARAKELALSTEVRRAYIDYWKSREMQSLLNERAAVVSAHTRRLNSGSLSTQLMQAHLEAAETDLNLIESELDAAREEETGSRAQLNTLMGRDPFAPLDPPGELPLSPLPPRPTSEQVQATTERHPEVQESSLMAQAAEAETRAARSEALPDFTIAYRYNDNTANAADRSNSELMVGITLPFLYFWQTRSLNQAAEGRQRLAEAQLRARHSRIRLQVFQRYTALASLRSQVLRFQNTLVPGSNRRLRLAHGIAPTDMESLDEHRSAMESSVELRIKALNLRADYERSLADFDNLMARDGQSGGTP